MKSHMSKLQRYNIKHKIYNTDGIKRANLLKHQNGIVLMVCAYCKIQFKRWKSEDKHKNNFCSRKCVGKYKSKFGRKENNANWRGGKSFEKYPEEFFIKRKQIYKRDNYTCQICSKYNIRCQCHHIDYNKKNNNSNNLITLCKKCHGKTNHNHNTWTKLLKSKVKS